MRRRGKHEQRARNRSRSGSDYGRGHPAVADQPCRHDGGDARQGRVLAVISEGLDFAGALFNKDGHLVACGDRDLTGLLGTLEPTLELMSQVFPDDQIKEGDIIICNSPHEAGNHLNDVRMVKPLFHDGELVAFVANVGHWTDIGGSTPGSINPLARDAFSEGLRITPVKLVDRGEYRRDVANMILANVRLPYEANGDIWAQMKSLDAGETRLQQLLERYGASTILSVFSLMQDHAEAVFLEELSVMADGTVEFEDFIDEDPLDPERRPVRIHLRLTKQGRSLTFDFSESDPQPRAGIGSTRPLTQSGVYVGTLNCFHNIPFNHGFIRNIEIVTVPGTAVQVSFPNPGVRLRGRRIREGHLVRSRLHRPARSDQAGGRHLQPDQCDAERNRPSLQAAVRDVHVERGGVRRRSGSRRRGCADDGDVRHRIAEPADRGPRALLPGRLHRARDRGGLGGPGKWRGCPGSGTPIVRSATTR